MSNMKIDNDRLNQTIFNEDEKSSSLNHVNEHDIKDFERELQENYKQTDNKQANLEENSLETTNNFETFFSNMFSSQKTEQTSSLSSLTDNNMDFELTDKLIDKILISDTKANGEQEIRMQLDSNVLKDTEICLKRNADGSLHIALHSSDASSIQTLVAQQYELKNRLEQLENTEVTVQVNPQDQENNDSNKKSRGLFDIYEQYNQN